MYKKTCLELPKLGQTETMASYQGFKFHKIN